MNVALFLDGEVYNNDAIFDTSDGNWLNHDDLLYVWINMRDHLTALGYNVHTYDRYASFEDIHKAVFFGLYEPNLTHFKRLQEMGVDCYYVAYEPPVIHHYNEQAQICALSHHFRRILTHQDDLIDNGTFLRISEGKVRLDMSRYRDIPFDERYFMLMMNSYRYANFDGYRELYSERFRASSFFEQASDSFHVYGRGLNDPARIQARWGHKPHVHFHSYVGEAENKIEAMSRYRFHLCIENCAGVYGYISEKILHSFYAGVVPVYWGPVNPLDYFDEGTFIDIRAFDDYADLNRYLQSIDAKRFEQYREAIRAYLDSERYRRFFGPEVFGQQMAALLADGHEQRANFVAQGPAPIITTETLPRISILIPTRNRAALLAQSLDCLAAQNYPNLEVVLVDDASDDDTPRVIADYQQRLPGIVARRNEACIGAALGFQKAAEHATGDYVLNFSDDDLLAPGALADFVAPLRQHDYDMIYSDLEVIDQHGATSSVWAYQSWAQTHPLLRKLIEAGSNQIPETLLVRRSLYPRMYGEFYSRRFITPFYLPFLKTLKMHHIPRSLYRYRVHAQSTFKDTGGLVVRNKGVMNYMTLIQLMHSPAEVFGIQPGHSQDQRVTVALAQFIATLLNHAGGFVQGTFYTGASYTEKDLLWAIFYEYARYWLRLAERFGVFKDELAKLDTVIRNDFARRPYDAVKTNRLPEVYRKLPWYAYRPINDVTEFIPLDIACLGAHPLFEDSRLPLLVDGTRNIYAANHTFSRLDDLMAFLETHPAHVVNIFDSSQRDAALATLEASGRYAVCVADATGRAWPDTSLLVHRVILSERNLSSTEAYLKALCDTPIQTGRR